MEGISELLLVWIKVLEARASVKINKMNKIIQDLVSDEGDKKKNPIGFAAPIAVEEDEEEDEDYDD